MDKSKLFKTVVYLAFFLYLADMLADKFYWYYSIWWFDMPMHFLGGFWEGVFFLWYFSMVRLPFLRRPILKFDNETVWHTLLFVLFIGISWEAGQFLTENYIGGETFVVLDAASDVFFDLAGGAVAVVYALRKNLFNSQSN